MNNRELFQQASQNPADYEFVNRVTDLITRYFRARNGSVTEVSLEMQLGIDKQNGGKLLSLILKAHEKPSSESQKPRLHRS